MTTVSYAQNLEDIMLLRAFKGVERGFYVDVGAWSPVEDSVTKLFYDLGWSGINIEPVKHWHARLKKERPRDVNLRIAAGARRGRASIHVVGETGLSTVSDELSARYAAQSLDVADEKVEVRTLDSVLEEHAHSDIHFLKIDTEGSEKDVLAGLDLKRRRPWILVIEAGEPTSQIESHAAWEPMVLEAGYVFVYGDGLNRFYLAAERGSLKEAFRYPPSVFDDYIQYRYSERLEWYAGRVAEVQALADARGGQVDAMSRDVQKTRESQQHLIERLDWYAERMEEVQALADARRDQADRLSKDIELSAAAQRQAGERLQWYAERMEEVQTLADARDEQLRSRERDMERMRTGMQQLLERIAPACQVDEEARPGEAQLFVDVTMLAASDAGTGIQRVVRNILAEFLQSKPEGFEVAPVRFVKGSGYVHARKFHSRGSSENDRGEELPIRPLPGDLVLGLDLIADILPDHREYFEWLRARGAALWFVVYDLLPVLRPEFFPAGALGVFRQWYAAIADLATGVVCISESVADEYKRWLDQIQPKRETALQLGYFHLGANMDRSMAPTPEPVSSRDPRLFLMVGTIEVRKGHAQVLDAFEDLWARGVEAKLLVIGKPGWLSDDVMARLSDLAARGRAVQWLASASDAELLEAYSTAGALIMASEGEGYGLPIIEAAMHGLPVITRDLPVFREVAGSGALYFDGTSGEILADAIERWMRLGKTGSQPSPEFIARMSWRESAQQLLHVIRYGAQGQWHAGTEYAFDAMHPVALTVVGRQEKGAIAADGRSGYLVYGPYFGIAAGRYRVSVRLGAVSPLPEGSVLDIVAGNSDSPLHRVDLQGLEASSGVLTIEFPLRLDVDVDRFQIRIFVGEGADVCFLGSTLTPQGLSDTYTRAVRAEAASKAEHAQAEQLAGALEETARSLREAQDEVAAAGEQIAEAITALRHAHAEGDVLRAELSRIDGECAHWRERAMTMESSRSWRITAPLRKGRAAAVAEVSRIVSVLRPLWHVAVRSKAIAAIALLAVKPVPRLHARLRRSIAHHHEMQSSPPSPALAPALFPTGEVDAPAMGVRTAYTYTELIEARKLATGRKGA